LVRFALPVGFGLASCYHNRTSDAWEEQMVSAGDVFLHSYGDALEHLKLIQTETALDAKTDAKKPHVHVVLTEQFQTMVGSLIDDLSVEKPEPEVVLKRAFAAMNRIERHRFLLENLLEAVKRDESLQNSLGTTPDWSCLTLNSPTPLKRKDRAPGGQTPVRANYYGRFGTGYGGSR
jgi:hypothetical protein